MRRPRSASSTCVRSRRWNGSCSTSATAASRRRASSTSTRRGSATRSRGGPGGGARGPLNPPQILIRSGLPESAGNSPSSEWIGRNLGLHPAAFVFGLFDEVQDAHRVYPITSHCMDFMRDEDGGFVLEASTIQDPIGFATSIADEDGPLWGERLVEAGRRYRHWNGILVLANDENNGRVVVGEDGTESFEAHFDQVELE